MTLLISNLPDFIDNHGVTTLFKLFGEVVFVHVFENYTNNGTAIVTMRDKEKAIFAVEVLNGLFVEPKQLKVDILKTTLPVSAQIKHLRSPYMFLLN